MMVPTVTKTTTKNPAKAQGWTNQIEKYCSEHNAYSF
jgi:hypothetical protein